MARAFVANSKRVNGNRTPEYVAYGCMLARCGRPSHRDYPRYGGRGICVAPEWIGADGFDNFLSHLGTRPGALYSLDRIDNDRGYEPGNVRWATALQQQNNTCRNRHLTVNGCTRTLSQWSASAGISHASLRARIRTGWDLETAVTAPPRSGKRPGDGPVTCWVTWCRSCGTVVGAADTRVAAKAAAMICGHYERITFRATVDTDAGAQ